MTDREDRIRQLAYFLWLEEGCPQGEAERHWQAAEVLFESEPVERKEREGQPPGRTGRQSTNRRRQMFSLPPAQPRRVFDAEPPLLKKGNERVSGRQRIARRQGAVERLIATTTTAGVTLGTWPAASGAPSLASCRGMI